MAVACLTYSVRLAVQSPFLFRGLTLSALGIDGAALRNAQGVPLIPADQVRGVIKDMLRELPDGMVEGACGLTLDQLFGAASPDKAEGAPQNLPKRRRIHFTDLTAPQTYGRAASHSHTRIAIDDSKGTVSGGALQVIELVAPMGQVVCFDGRIQVIADPGRAAAMKGLLDKAVALLGSIGSLKSCGFGEVVVNQSAITYLPDQSPDLPVHFVAAPEPWPYGDRLRLRVSFDRPILFDSRRLADNAVVSASTIPGSAVKGALADVIEHATGAPPTGDLARALTAMRLSHAVPVSKDGTPLSQPLPQSLMAVATQGPRSSGVSYGDAIRLPLGVGAMIDGKPALNIGDWKSNWFSGAYDALGWGHADLPPTESRTHTAIDPAFGSAAEGQLYTTHFQSVKFADGSNCFWQMEVDLGRVSAGPQRAMAQALVRMLIDRGLYGMGGTGATARFSVVEGAPGTDPPLGSTVCLRLLTPALLFHANDVWPDQDSENSTEQVYGAYFNGLSPDITLQAVFARQRVVGGYLARRRRAYGDFYFPFVVTEPGAVFLLDCPTEESQQALAERVRWGLTPPPYRETPTANPQPMTWEKCPFMTENGFGAVVVDDLADPRRKALQEGLVHV